MLGAVGEASGFANAVVVDAVVGDVRLVSERRPRAEYKRILLHRLHWFGEVYGHESSGHFSLSLGLGIMLLAAKIAQIFSQ